MVQIPPNPFAEETQPETVPRIAEEPTDLRQCSSCGQRFPEKKFGKVNKTTRRKICNRCHRVSNLARKHGVDPRVYLDIANSPCAICGDTNAALVSDDDDKRPVITLCRKHSTVIRNIRRQKNIAFYVDIMDNFPFWARWMVELNYRPEWLDTTKPKT